MREPLYKASVTKAIWHEVELLPPNQRLAIAAAVGPEQIEAIATAGRTSWLPARIQAAIDQAVFDVVGVDAQVDLMRRYTLKATLTPVFAPIARGTLSLFGAGPLAVLRSLPKTWPFVSKHCAILTLESHDQSATLIYAQLAPVLRTVSFATSTRGSLEGVLEFVAAIDGRVEIDVDEIEGGVVRQHLSWRAS